ncbi:hypothetical protein KIW84_054453 [Lathyrus oleraceus]|uniref:F-box protein n=1 Tax=Pisum sativum TaxID=3888 RepID=A0A9D4WT38_PEA|nr:hypothetical protein KIW84_054453 [Pisum sativum]
MYADDSCITLEGLQPYQHGHQVLFSHSGERFKNKVKLDLPPPFQENDTCFEFLGSVVDGTICFYQGMVIPKIVFWNLSTKEFKVLPPSPLESVPPYYERVFCEMHGFGYDHVNDDHKVVRHVAHCRDLTNYEDMPTGYVNPGQRFHTNGVCHWWDSTNGQDCLVSFDLNSNKFFRTPPPPDGRDNFNFILVDRRFVGLNGSAACISSYETSHATPNTFYISILGELGVKESWTKLFIIGSLPCLDHPIGAGNKGDIFFKSKEDEIVQVDLITQMVKKLGIREPLNCTKVLYKEVLLPIGGEKYAGLKVGVCYFMKILGSAVVCTGWVLIASSRGVVPSLCRLSLVVYVLDDANSE